MSTDTKEIVTIPNARFFGNAPFGKLFDHQLDMLRAFDEKRARRFLLEWHRRCRKTSLAINLMIREAARCPKSRYIYLAPTAVDMRKIVWDDPEMLMEALPDRRAIGWKINETRAFVKFYNGSIIQFWGADDPESLRGPKFRGITVDEWSKHKKEVWDVLSPIFREDNERWAIFTYTPVGVNHATEMFDRAACLDSGGVLPTIGPAAKMLPGWYASRVVASASGIIPKDQLEEAQKENPPWFFEQEYLCARITLEEMVLISTALMETLRGLQIANPFMRRIIAIDPDCSIDGDECVMQYHENHEVKDEEAFHERDPLKIAMRAQLFGAKNHCEHFAVDWTGVGTGVCGKLSELGKRVYEFNGSNSPANDRFANLRAEAYWSVMEKMQNYEIPFPNGAPGKEGSGKLLRQDLSSIRVKPQGSNGRIALELKAQTKKRLGRSPDRGDCFTIGVWGSQFVPVDGESYTDVGSAEDSSDMATSYTVESKLW